MQKNAQMDHLIEQVMQREHIPGLAFAFVRGQEVVAARGYGITAVEDGGLPVTPQTLFCVGSTTKPVVGTAILRLVEAGQLDLDQPINRSVDWLTFTEPDAAERITLRMLLTHTAGLPNDSVAGSRDPEGLEQYVRERLPKYRFVAPPGTLFSYSNIGLNLAGYLAQVVTNTPFSRLMQKTLLAPLGMQRSTFDPLIAMTYPLAQPHTLGQDGNLRVVHHFTQNTAYDPSGGLYSTAQDLATFALLHLQQGTWQGQRLLSVGSVSHMHRAHTPTYKTSPEDGYGLTFETTTLHGIRCVGHHGIMHSFGCQLTLLPDQAMGCIVLLNRQPSLAPQLAFSILETHLDLPQVVPVRSHQHANPADWPFYTGTYLGPRTGLASVSSEQGQLLLTHQQQTIPLQPYQPGIYTGRAPASEASITVAFLPARDEPAQYLVINRAVHTRIDVDSSRLPDPQTYERFAGRYRSGEDEVAETITIRLEGDTLLMQLVDNDTNEREGILTPIDDTSFAWGGGLIEFQSAADGTITALHAMDVYTFRRVVELTEEVRS